MMLNEYFYFILFKSVISGRNVTLYTRRKFTSIIFDRKVG